MTKQQRIEELEKRLEGSVSRDDLLAIRQKQQDDRNAIDGALQLLDWLLQATGGGADSGSSPDS